MWIYLKKLKIFKKKFRDILKDREVHDCQHFRKK